MKRSIDAQIFWNIIGDYNQATWVWQCAIMALVVTGLIAAWRGRETWLLKTALGIANLFIGIVFFLLHGTEPIQTWFAAPLFIAMGLLFVREAAVHSDDKFDRPGKVQWILWGLVAAYPLVSLFIGHSWPEIVVWIMPCPVASASIVAYSGYTRKNRLLLGLMALWGLTGIKAFFFDAMEDTILLVCGVYCLWMLITEWKKLRNDKIENRNL